MRNWPTHPDHLLSPGTSAQRTILVTGPRNWTTAREWSWDKSDLFRLFKYRHKHEWNVQTNTMTIQADQTAWVGYWRSFFFFFLPSDFLLWLLWSWGYLLDGEVGRLVIFVSKKFNLKIFTKKFTLKITNVELVHPHTPHSLRNSPRDHLKTRFWQVLIHICPCLLDASYIWLL